MHENVTVQQRVSAPVDKVWNALTDKAQMKEWYFDIPDFELGIHKKFNFFWPDKKYHNHGEILVVIPNEKLKNTYSYPEYSKEKSIVKWELEKDGDETVVTVTHKGLENFAHLGKDFQKESFKNGWTEILEKKLKEFVEK